MELSGGELQEQGDSRMQELTSLVQKVTRSSSWWERHGVDWAWLILALCATPAGFMLLQSERWLPLCLGILLLGTTHTIVSVKGSHLASHSSLSQSRSWNKLWAVLFIEVCGSFTAEVATHQHVKLHHAYTNIIGLGDSSTWKAPFFPRYIYLFILPLAVPLITPIVALGLIQDLPGLVVLRTLCTISLGMLLNCWLLLTVSGFRSLLSAFLCMLLYKALYSIPYIHVNIFQHIGLAMFSLDKKPKRIYQMAYGVLNLPRNPLLDWSFGHSLINCHVEHHLFPTLSDNMCLKVKPIVSNYFKQHNIPYNEESYLSRLRLFIDRYQQLMVDAPCLTELVGIQ
ncbi:fatty acid desaturase 6 [Hemiscyllium ocellatum]|uniref:fatty acid desaturase 6 n=1 Tax=Hemiscyllium ocellatum TaxID=170820 RepID=UPI0029668C0D|nr:fatty acid desaturase 6 [Hemiscyllium ocellatum]